MGVDVLGVDVLGDVLGVDFLKLDVMALLRFINVDLTSVQH